MVELKKIVIFTVVMLSIAYGLSYAGEMSIERVRTKIERPKIERERPKTERLRDRPRVERCDMEAIKIEDSKEKDCIEIELKGEQGQPIDPNDYRVEMEAGETSSRGSLGSGGQADTATHYMEYNNLGQTVEEGVFDHETGELTDPDIISGAGIQTTDTDFQMYDVEFKKEFDGDESTDDDN